MIRNSGMHRAKVKKSQTSPSRKGILWVIFAAMSMAAGVISFVPCVLMAVIGYGLGGTV